MGDAARAHTLEILTISGNIGQTPASAVTISGNYQRHGRQTEQARRAASSRSRGTNTYTGVTDIG